MKKIFNIFSQSQPEKEVNNLNANLNGSWTDKTLVPSF